MTASIADVLPYLNKKMDNAKFAAMLSEVLKQVNGDVGKVRSLFDYAKTMSIITKNAFGPWSSEVNGLEYMLDENRAYLNRHSEDNSKLAELLAEYKFQSRVN